jgi:predicted AAA+ superfamily ATPase
MIYRLNNINRLLDKGQSLLIIGPRGSGKSFFIRNLKNKPTIQIDLLLNSNYRKYRDNPSLLYSEIQLLLESNKNLTVFIDEIQRVTELLNEVHKLIEDFKPKLNFILTGSSARKLKRSEANLLAGRAILIEFFPLSHDEIDFNLNLSKLLQWGTLPEIFLEDDPELKFLKLDTYVNTYLAEEIRIESQLRNIDGFGKFLEVAAQLNGQVVNKTKIAKIAGISDGSVATYYEILEETLIANKIPAWEHSKVKQLIKSAKYYFFDNGVLNALAGRLRDNLRESSYEYGKLFENLVINEIIRYNKKNKLGANLFHYRTNNGQEIDLIIQKNAFSSPIAIEIKSSHSPENEKKLTALKSFKQEFKDAKLFVLSKKELPHRSDGIRYENFVDGINKIFEEL